jgi:hypothetical protein
MDRVGFEPTTSVHPILVPSAIDGNVHNISLLIIEEADCLLLFFEVAKLL